jgi:hypothetical protein
MEYQPGIYEVISDVKIRREPRIVEGNVTNQVGLLKAGTRREVYSILTVKDNTFWGRVSGPDAAGISQWACIKGLNRTYMRFVEPLPSEPGSPERFMQWARELHEWALGMGFMGKPPF